MGIALLLTHAHYYTYDVCSYMVYG